MVIRKFSKFGLRKTESVVLKSAFKWKPGSALMRNLDSTVKRNPESTGLANSESTRVSE
jgi:hypothetical protein